MKADFMDEGILRHLQKVADRPARTTEVEVSCEENGGIRMVPRVHGHWRYDQAIYLDEDQTWDLRTRLRALGSPLPPGGGVMFHFILYAAFIIGVIVGVMIS